jgi:MraZ protein
MLAHATEVDMDSSGRLLIPSVLRERVNLDKSSMLIGQGNTFQLWNEAEWNSLMQEDLTVLRSDELDSDDLPDLFY